MRQLEAQVKNGGGHSVAALLEALGAPDEAARNPDDAARGQARRRPGSVPPARSPGC